MIWSVACYDLFLQGRHERGTTRTGCGHVDPDFNLAVCSNRGFERTSGGTADYFMSHGEGPAGTHRSAQHSDARLQLSRGTPGKHRPSWVDNCCFNARIEGKDHQYWGQRCSRFAQQSVGWQASSALLERAGSFETCATTVSPVPFASSIRGIFYPRQFEPSSRSNASGRQSIISGLRTRLLSFIAPRS